MHSSLVQPMGQHVHIVEGSTSCAQSIDVGEQIPSPVMADDVHGTGGLDLVVTSSRGDILTLQSDVVPYHPLNIWNSGESRSPSSSNAQTHGFSAKQGIFVHPISRQFRNILGIYVPITFGTILCDVHHLISCCVIHSLCFFLTQKSLIGVQT